MTLLETYRRRRALRAAKTVDLQIDPVQIGGPVVLEGEVTGDGRYIMDGAISWQDDPVPILWDRDDGDHTGQIVGTLTAFDRPGDGRIFGAGTLSGTEDPDAEASVRRVMELVADNAIGWSVGLDNLEEADPEVDDIPDDAAGAWLVVKEARIRHIALVDTPAFAEARPSEIGATAAAMGSTWLAANFARQPTREFTPLTVDPATGAVYGHGAGGDCHRGYRDRCKRYDGDYDRAMRNFHTGAPIELDSGETIRPGPLTFAGLHAPATSSSPAAMRRHHEDGSTTVALVRAWDDDRGRLWVSGQLVAGLDDRTVDQMQGSAVSYERWGTPGRETLVGLHLVPTPGHPVAASVASGYVAVDCGCGETCTRHAG